MRIGPVLAVVLVALAASALWWLETLRQPTAIDVADPAEYHAPETYFDHFEARAWDTPGPPRHVVSGIRMVRFTDDGSSDIDAPRVFYRDPQGPPWYAVSDTGHVDGSGERIDLRERVVATRAPDSPDPLILRTDTLHIDLATGHARTGDPVDVVTTGSRVHSVGMTATFDTGLVELHSDVRGRHDPAIAPE